MMGSVNRNNEGKGLPAAMIMSENAVMMDEHVTIRAMALCEVGLKVVARIKGSLGIAGRGCAHETSTQTLW